MSAIQIAIPIIIAISNVFLAVLIEFINVKCKFVNKLNRWIKILVTGSLFGLLAIFSIYYGFSYDLSSGVRSVLAFSSIPILIVGIVFGHETAFITTIYAIFFRVFMIPIDEIDVFRYTSLISILIAFITIFVLDLFAFKTKKTFWGYCFFIGIFTESLSILVIFLFKINSIQSLYDCIAQYDLIDVFLTGGLLGLTSIFISLVDGDIDNIKIHIKHKTLGSVAEKRLFLASLITFALSFSTAFFINYQKTRIDNQNILISSVQDETSHADAVPEEIENIANETHILNEGFVIITDLDSEIISIRSDLHNKYKGYVFSINDHGKSHEIRDFDSDTPFVCTWEKNQYLCYYMITVDSEYNVIGLVPMTEIFANVGIAVRVVSYLLVIIFCVLFILIDYFIQTVIVNNIHKVNVALRDITYGNLDREVNVTSTVEFEELSEDINITVGALKNYAGEIESRMAAENELAQNVQKNSVPNSFPYDRRYDIYASMQTANEVCGDFYDYMLLNENKVAFLIAGVSGKGIAAAMYMVRAKTLIKTLLANEKNTLEKVITNANKEMYEENAAMTISLFVAILDTKTGDLEYINAGHDNPIIKKDKTIEILKTNIQSPLIVNKDIAYKSEHIILQKNDELFLYTEGLSKLISKYNKDYGPNDIAKNLGEIQYFNSKQLITNIFDDLNKNYIKDKSLDDDISLLSFRYTNDVENNPEHEITLKAIPNNTPIATKFVESIMQQYNCSQKSQAIILIAVDELFSNIAYYAYKGQPEPGNGTIQIKIKGTEFNLILIDNGTPFDPTARLDPNYINAAAEDRMNKGGLGIFMVRQSVDDIKYRYENGQNILTITKIIPEMKEEVFKDSYSTTRD